MLENEIVTMGAKRFLRRPGFGSVCDRTQPEADLQGCNCRFLHNWMAGLAQLPGSDKARKQLCQIHIVVVATHDMGPFHGLNGRYKNVCYFVSCSGLDSDHLLSVPGDRPTLPCSVLGLLPGISLCPSPTLLQVQKLVLAWFCVGFLLAGPFPLCFLFLQAYFCLVLN